MTGTSFCVVTMDRGPALRESVRTIATHAAEPYEIIVVDNGSTDPDAVEALSEIDVDRVIRNSANLGLSVATNQGFEAARYDCLVHLDDDCLVRHDGWNRIIENHFDATAKIGMVVPTTTPLSIDHGTYREITWGLGMCWAIRASLVDDIGGYDPQLLHQNECDMALRVRLAGFHVAAVDGFTAIHNDPGEQRSPMSIARERLGCVQFRDKWASYFRGRDWNYGTDPIYLMQHWPPDQDFLRRFAWQAGVDLNPYDGDVVGDVSAQWDLFEALPKTTIGGVDFSVVRELRNDYGHWYWKTDPGCFARDREEIIAEWHALTGEIWEGYQWPVNALRPY